MAKGQFAFYEIEGFYKDAEGYWRNTTQTFTGTVKNTKNVLGDIFRHNPGLLSASGYTLHTLHTYDS